MASRALPPELPLIAMDNTLGAWLLGVVGTVLLNGMMFHQVFHYFRLFPNDRMLLKIWVLVVVILETFITTMTIHPIYFYLITKYWEPSYFFLEKTVWSINLLPIPGSIAALLSQLFFARRVWMISPRFRPLVGVAILLISGNVACFAVLSSKMYKSQTLSEWLAFSWVASVGSAVQMAGDIMMTGTLIFVLRESRTGINRTDSMLDVLVTYAVTTGLINCIVHVLNVAFAIKYPDNFIYAALSCILTKLYANTFLAALNTRKSMGALGATDDDAPYGIEASRRMHGSRGPVNMPITSGTSQPTTIELKVTTEVTMDDDALSDPQTTKRLPMRRGDSISL